MSYHIIGDKDTILGYRLAGITGDSVETRAEALEAFRRATSRREPGILLLTDAVEELISDEVIAHRLTAEPPYLAVVRSLSGVPKARKSMQSIISEAVGIKLVENP